MKLATPPKEPPRESIVPMINVVFLLLIFFLMTATLTPPEPLQVEPARSDTAEPGEAKPVIFLNRDGEIAFRDVRGDAAIAAAAAEGAGLIRADAAAPAQAVARLLGALQAAGLSDLSLVTVPR
ncbi:biopolymer transporter ExbD [Paroceanicella profunda]|uniref:Biopolymer transporter ExbD n=1 Tax=Paroceanicella profunda TaxID=2579971 RepID=A0A5B8FGG5_9RHOB|nr:biopolymer transporter ExbD [Paroceanicella profunda]QDL91201.1 biopolymer transporter ExbD [Paroceanicella profunda]